MLVELRRLEEDVSIRRPGRAQGDRAVRRRDALAAGFVFREGATIAKRMLPAAIVDAGVATAGTWVLGERLPPRLESHRVASGTRSALHPMPSGPGPRIARNGPVRSPEMGRSEERCRTQSLPRSCFNSKRPMPGSSTSRPRGVRPRPAMARWSRGRGPVSHSVSEPFGRDVLDSGPQLPEPSARSAERAGQRGWCPTLVVWDQA